MSIAKVVIDLAKNVFAVQDDRPRTGSIALSAIDL